MIAEVDEPGISADCGLPPVYVPTRVPSGCYSRFSQIYNYDDFSGLDAGETRQVRLIEGRVQGGDNCQWQVVAEISVE
ncbi:MAG: hypothetical protein H6702_06105 [Myxococcales bacterium]|nr:hypothetical protein [Myxococcales bacterium]